MLKRSIQSIQFKIIYGYVVKDNKGIKKAHLVQTNISLTEENLHGETLVTKLREWYTT